MFSFMDEDNFVQINFTVPMFSELGEVDNLPDVNLSLTSDDNFFFLFYLSVQCCSGTILPKSSKTQSHQSDQCLAEGCRSVPLSFFSMQPLPLSYMEQRMGYTYRKPLQHSPLQQVAGRERLGRDCSMLTSPSLLNFLY